MLRLLSSGGFKKFIGQPIVIFLCVTLWFYCTEILKSCQWVAPRPLQWEVWQLRITDVVIILIKTNIRKFVILQSTGVIKIEKQGQSSTAADILMDN